MISVGSGYILKRSNNARTMRLEVRQDGAVVLTVPEWANAAAIAAFFATHAAWAERAAKRMEKRDVIHLARKDISSLKKKALALTAMRAEHFARIYGVSWKKISIRAQKSRWGSCSRQGHLSFNYKIAALPLALVEYIVVHEVCHLREMNHSQRFWDLVAREIPDHPALRKKLRHIAFVFF